MSVEQIPWHVTQARTAESIESKLEHILKALDATAYAMRELESKVNSLLERR